MKIDIYLVKFIIIGVPLAASPPEYRRGGGQVTGMVLIVSPLAADLGGWLLLLHLDWPHLAVQRQRGHSQTLVLLLAVKIIEIPAGRHSYSDDL